MGVYWSYEWTPARRGNVAGYAGPAYSANSGTRPGARTHDCPRHRAALRRRSAGGARIALSRAPPPGGPGLDRLVLGDLGEQSQSPLLPAYGDRAQAVN